MNPKVSTMPSRMSRTFCFLKASNSWTKAEIKNRTEETNKRGNTEGQTGNKSAVMMSCQRRRSLTWGMRSSPVTTPTFRSSPAFLTTSCMAAAQARGLTPPALLTTRIPGEDRGEQSLLPWRHRGGRSLLPWRHELPAACAHLSCGCRWWTEPEPPGRNQERSPAPAGVRG